MEPLDLLVCAATEMELSVFGEPWPNAACVVTGVGIPLALMQMMESIGRLKPARILNVGIAGAYPGSGLVVGDIVMGLSEVYGDVGFELPDSPAFRPIREVSWGDFYGNALPLTRFPEFSGTALGHGCTVNACTGTEATGQLREALYGAAFETMEGAAVVQAGRIFGIPVCEIRAISNVAARRDMRPENIELALDRLHKYFLRCRENLHA